MAIKYMNLVWEGAQLGGTDLLMLLAIADNANDAGICWPGIKYLAHKTRVSERQAQRLINKLENEGYIEISERKGGKSKSSLYRITERVTSMSPFETSGASKGDIQGLKGDIAMSPEPLLTIKETVAADAAPANPPSNGLPEAVKVFRENTHRYPSKVWYSDIEQVVGDKPESLELWRRVIKEWLGLGFNPVNVKGMLDAFQVGGIKRRTQPKGIEVTKQTMTQLQEEGWFDGEQS
jgi:DNA-binding transcriptional MocR family regulator